MICLSLAHCTSGCVNGVCTGPDTCVCDEGWRGKDCSSSMSRDFFLFDILKI